MQLIRMHACSRVESEATYHLLDRWANGRSGNAVYVLLLTPSSMFPWGKRLGVAEEGEGGVLMMMMMMIEMIMMGCGKGLGSY